MTGFILPREQYGRLVGTELEAIVPHLPADARVIVVEDGGVLVGCWSVIPIHQAEGVWIHPAYRGRGDVARRLLRGMVEVAQQMGARAVHTAAASAAVEALLERLGATRIPGAIYVMAIPEDTTCQQP